MARKRKSWWTYRRCKLLVLKLRSRPWYANATREYQRSTWRSLTCNPHSTPSVAWQKAWGLLPK